MMITWVEALHQGPTNKGVRAVMRVQQWGASGEACEAGIEKKVWHRIKVAEFPTGGRVVENPRFCTLHTKIFIS